MCQAGPVLGALLNYLISLQPPQEGVLESPLRTQKLGIGRVDNQSHSNHGRAVRTENAFSHSWSASCYPHTIVYHQHHAGLSVRTDYVPDLMSHANGGRR